MRRVRLGAHRVLADAVDRCELTAFHRVEHVREVPAVLRHDGTAPRRFEPSTRLVILHDVLEARELVGDRTHVAAALHVVLSSQRVQTTAVFANVAGEEPEVDQGEHVVDRGVVLGDPEGPADHGPVGLRVQVRDLTDHLRGNARDLLAEVAIHKTTHRLVFSLSQPMRWRNVLVQHPQLCC